MIETTFNALRQHFVSTASAPFDDAALLKELVDKIKKHNLFVTGAFVVWEDSRADAPKAINLNNGSKLFFSSSASTDFIAKAKNTLAILEREQLFVSRLLHNQNHQRSKQIDLIHSCHVESCFRRDFTSIASCGSNVDDEQWYCVNLLCELSEVFDKETDKETAKKYRTYIQGYFPDSNEKYTIAYCPFLVPDGKPPGNYFGVYKCNGNCKDDLLPHLSEIQHAGTLIYARRAIKNATNEIVAHGRRSSIAAIMSRNMSHNIGSHVLSQIDDDAMKQVQDMRTLHAYLQRRMDLVARITSRLPDWGEPLWFFGDLLRGFFSQAILLNHLVKDQGGDCKEKIKFYVTMQVNSISVAKEITYAEADADTKYAAGWHKSLDDALSCERGLKDFLVSIPDGAIGAQSFYVFLESVMRNSAKYGLDKSKQTTFEIHLDLTDCSEYYEIAVWDNLATCPEPNGAETKLCADMQEKLKEELLNAKSLGIAEMREACGFLIHPYGNDYPVYPASPVTTAAGDACQYCGNNAGASPEKEPFPLWVECYKNNGGSFLRYRLHLVKPRLVGIAGLDKNAFKSGLTSSGVWAIESKEAFLGLKGAYQFGVIVLKEDVEKIADLSDWIVKNRAYLPQRLLLVSASDDSRTIDYIRTLHRRAVICSKDEIGLKNILQDSIDNGTENQGENFIRCLYETWLSKRWPQIANGIELNIVIDRPSPLPNAWGRQLVNSKVLTANATINAYPVNDTNGKKWGEPITRKCLEKNGSAPTVIDYTNHRDYGAQGRVKELIKFTGDDKTFATLFHAAPQTSFGMDWLLLGLIEAALARVVVVDERVALWACQDGKSSASIGECAQAFVWPIFKLSDSSGDHWLVDYLRQCVEKKNGGPAAIIDDYCLPSWAIEPEKQPEIYGIAERSKEVPEHIHDIDIVLVHIGVAETVGKTVLGDAEKFMKSGYGVAPVVIMTSGRGGAADKRAGYGMPFIEYSAVRECFVNYVAKYHLVRAMMSTKARKES